VSTSIRSVIIIFVLSVVFEELGLAEQTMLVTFGLAFGAVDSRFFRLPADFAR